MGLQLNIESIKDLKEELEPIISANHKEVELYQGEIALSPNWDRYFSLEDMGMLQVNTVRDGDELVGYYINIISPSLHHSKDIFACCDTVYIKPALRKTGIAYRLVKYAEANAKDRGVSLVIINTKINSPLDRLLDKLGWCVGERLFTKLIK